MSQYWDNLARHDGGACIDEIWLSHPLVRAEVNRRVSGDAGKWPADWLREQIVETLPNTLSIGCGTGAFERGVVSQNIVERITGIDLVPQPLERARELAAPFGSRISYLQADAMDVLRNGSFDAVFFHQSLHHFADPAAVLLAVRSALRPGGYLYIDEYVGPSRDEWNVLRLLPANLAYYRLPRSARRPHLVRAPINREDPTEAIASSRILPALRATFPNVIERPYGGNLLSVVYPNLRLPPSDEVVARLIALERWQSKSYYVVALARR